MMVVGPQYKTIPAPGNIPGRTDRAADIGRHLPHFDLADHGVGPVHAGRSPPAHPRSLGLGVFQLFDGVVNHKILRIHQIRSGVDLFF